MSVSRKVAIAWAGMGSSFLLALFGKLSGDYTTVVSVTVAAYMTANAFTWGAGGEAPK